MPRHGFFLPKNAKKNITAKLPQINQKQQKRAKIGKKRFCTRDVKNGGYGGYCGYFCISH